MRCLDVAKVCVLSLVFVRTFVKGYEHARTFVNASFNALTNAASSVGSKIFFLFFLPSSGMAYSTSSPLPTV